MAKNFWIYRNLRTGNFSLKHGSGGRVKPVAFAHLSNVKGHVRENGRQKVLLEKTKNVNAFLIASIINTTIENDETLNRIYPHGTGELETKYLDNGFREFSYNPYKRGEFYWIEDGQPIGYLKEVVLISGKCFGRKWG